MSEHQRSTAPENVLLAVLACLTIALPFLGFYLGSLSPTAPASTTATPPPMPLTPGDPVTTSPASSTPSSVLPTEPTLPPQDVPWQEHSSSPRESTPELPPPFPNPEAQCGVTNCHGPAVACGATPPEGLMCTMEYRLGDFCRQYVSCETIAGSCQAVTDPHHQSCVSCVATCTAMSDPTEAFACEEQCRRSLEDTSE